MTNQVNASQQRIGRSALRLVSMAALAAGVTGLAGTADAALLAYEGFDYTDATELVGQSGGSGWSGDWYKTSSSTQVSPAAVTEGLTFGALAVTGGAITMDNASANSSIAFRHTDAFSTGEVWVSFLVNPTTTNAASYFFAFSFYNGDDATAVATVQRAPVGSGSVEPWAISGSGASSPNTGVDMTIGHTYLMVAHFEFNVDGTRDRLSLYIDPTPGAPLPVEPSLTLLSGVSNNLSWDRIRLGSAESRAWTVDEVRIGETFADVTPVPEPAAGALLLPLLAGLGVRRRAR